MRLSSNLSSLTVAAIGATLTLGASPATASQPECGAVVKKSVTLKKDLLGCTGDGLVIGRSGITVDLDGHRVEAGSFNHSTGIRNSGGYDRVRIVDGQVSRFETGILMVGSRHGKVARVTVTDTDAAGIDFRSSRYNRIVDNHVSSAHHGLQLTESHHNLMRDNSLLGDPALGLIDSNLNLLHDNDFSGGHGVWVRTSNDNLFRRNTARARTFPGFELISGSGNELRRNVASGNGAEGIVVYAGAQSTWLYRNTADDNSFEGIKVLSPSTVLRRNSASDNGDLGIDAVDGVTDAGGNRASGNGDPRQCVGVECAPAG